MRVIRPSVRILARTNEDAAGFIEHCARTCYASEPQGDANIFVGKLMQKGHMSPLEHWVATLEIICSIGIAREMMRHRLASYSEQSTRYVDVSKDEIAFIVPDTINDNLIFKELYYKYLETSERLYVSMIKTGVPKQYARDVLPLCTATKFVMTANLREWLHIIELRTAKGAHPEMRELAQMISGFIPFSGR